MNDRCPETIRKFFCNGCKHETRHVRKADYTHRYYDDESGEWAEGAWGIWQCLGCEDVLLSQSWVLSVDLPACTDGYEPEVALYPPRTSHRVEKKEYESIPDRLDGIYAEIIQAFNSRTHILCAAGLRALLEAICVDKDPSSGGPRIRLPQKMDRLKAFVPTRIVDNLHGFRFLGDKALHELECPKAKDLALAIEIIEDVLNVVYELDYKSDRLYRLLSGDSRSRSSGNGIDRAL